LLSSVSGGAGGNGGGGGGGNSSALGAPGAVILYWTEGY
jgi:hypothetical protein